MWDSSSLTKSYFPELGSDTVTRLFSLVPSSQMCTTIEVYAEVYWVLVRKRNSREISSGSFTEAIGALKKDILRNTEITLLHLEFSDVLAGIDLIERHSLNSADASMLALLLRYANVIDEGDQP